MTGVTSPRGTLIERMVHKVKFGYLRRLGFERLRYPTHPGSRLMRRAFAQFLHGDGVEIGALHDPLPLDGLPIERVRYVDCLPVAELRRRYREVADYRLARVDVLDDGERLAAFADDSLDFIIANHFIEHCRNPIGTLRNWLGRLRSGGVIYLAVPDMRRTFDSGRPLTTLKHLLDDDRASEDERLQRDHEHYRQWARFIGNVPEAETGEHVGALIAAGASIHFHTFAPGSFLELLTYAQGPLGLPFEIRAFATTWPGSIEFLAVIEKR